MTITDSLMFWKKKEEPQGTPVWDTPETPGPKFEELPPGTEVPNAPMPSFAPPSMPPPALQPSQESTGPNNRDIELILARLDTIKVQLENLNNRMAHLERIAEGQQPKW